jgi:hypothetical protein
MLSFNKTLFIPHDKPQYGYLVNNVPTEKCSFVGTHRDHVNLWHARFNWHNRGSVGTPQRHKGRLKVVSGAVEVTPLCYLRVKMLAFAWQE